jgi:hypothetical protein
MSVENSAGGAGNVESMFAEPPSTPVSDELGRLRGVLLEKLPRDALIKFEFDGRLQLHVYVGRYEDLAVVEALLPSLCGGIFGNLQRGMSGHSSFKHRVSASVDR